MIHSIMWVNIFCHIFVDIISGAGTFKILDNLLFKDIKQLGLYLCGWLLIVVNKCLENDIELL